MKYPSCILERSQKTQTYGRGALLNAGKHWFSHTLGSSSLHRGRSFAASLTPAFPSKPLSSNPDSTPERTIPPESQLNQTCSAGAESHIEIRYVVVAGPPGVIYSTSTPFLPLGRGKAAGTRPSHPFCLEFCQFFVSFRVCRV